MKSPNSPLGGGSDRSGVVSSLSSVLPTSQVFTSGYVNTETILHFFYKITNERGTKTVFTYAHVKWFYGQSERAYYLNYFIKDILSHIDRFRNETPKRNMISFRLQLSKLSLINAAPIYRHINFRHASTMCL